MAGPGQPGHPGHPAPHTGTDTERALATQAASRYLAEITGAFRFKGSIIGVVDCCHFDDSSSSQRKGLISRVTLE